MVHDFSNGIIVMSGISYNGVIPIDCIGRATSNAVVAHISSIAVMELWHAHFGNLNFKSLLRRPLSLVLHSSP